MRTLPCDIIVGHLIDGMVSPKRNTSGLVSVTRYSSADQSPQDRYAAWKEGSLLSFGQRFDTEPLSPFGAETAVAQLGAVGFSYTRMSSQNWRRGAEHVRSDGADPLMVSIRFTGTGRGDANGREFQAPPGCIALSDFAQPQAYFSETSFNAVMAIPREVAERRLPRVRDLHGVVIGPEAALLLRSHALALIQALDAGMPVRHAERLGGVALDLLEIGIAQSVPNASPSISAGQIGARLAAEAVIERNICNAGLSIQDVCRLVGVSRSGLYRLFDEDGGVLSYIRERRLMKIAECLRMGTHETLGALAFRLGFADASHLTRSFRSKFGVTPKEYRWQHGN